MDSTKTMTNNQDDTEAEMRLAESRERNREHARRTRQRKKAHLQALQTKLTDLETENLSLKQCIEECSVASILLNLSTGDEVVSEQVSTAHASSNDIETSSPIVSQEAFLTNPASSTAFLGDLKRKQIHSEEPIESAHHYQLRTKKTKNNICEQKALSPEELETLRRERNRMHAKMTRDRKKSYIANVERGIAKLEEDNQKMRDILICHASLAQRIQHTPTAPTDLASVQQSAPDVHFIGSTSASFPFSETSKNDAKSGSNYEQEEKKVVA